MRKNSKRSGKLCMTLGLLLTAAALFLTGYNLWGEYRAARNAGAALMQVEQRIPAETKSPETDDDKAKEQETEQEMPTGETKGAAEASGQGMTVQMIDGQEYIGVVEIPTLSLKLPVISEWNDERLKIAPCRYVGTAYTRDLILSGHSYKNHFRYIRKLVIGDPVIFTDMDGNRFVYEVSGTEVIDTNGVEEMEAGDWDLTLFTCTYNGSARHTVRCRLVPEENPWMDGH